MTEATPCKVILRTDTLSAEGETKVTVRLDSTASSSSPGCMSRHVPCSIPRDQLYYWTREWQEGEAEALAELERGEGVVFEDPKEAVRWLREARG